MIRLEFLNSKYAEIFPIVQPFFPKDTISPLLLLTLTKKAIIARFSLNLVREMTRLKFLTSENTIREIKSIVSTGNSAVKKTDWIIREFSLPVDSPTLIFLNLYCPEDSEYTLPLYDTLIESFVALSRFMIENERVHKLVYFDARDKQFVERIIDSIDALSNAACQIIMSIRDDLMCSKPEKYFLETQLIRLASFTYITADNNEEILTLIDNKLDADIKNAIISVKKDEHSSVKCSNYTTLSVTPVVIGRITSSIRDIEI